MFTLFPPLEFTSCSRITKYLLVRLTGSAEKYPLTPDDGRVITGEWNIGFPQNPSPLSPSQTQVYSENRQYLYHRVHGRYASFAEGLPADIKVTATAFQSRRCGRNQL